MDGAQGNSSSAPAPFLTKTYEMVEDPLTNSVVSWSHSGCSFVVWNPPEFARDLLPKYFKHNNFSSFIRQLNTYGFRKIDPEQWEFANEEFIRGQRHLLKHIHRRKPIHSHSGQVNSTNSITDSERQDYEEEIDRLRESKHSLELEVERYKQENQQYKLEFRSLGQRLQNIDSRQRQLVASLAQLLQMPQFSTGLLDPPENHKKRRLLISNYLQHEADARENQMLAIEDKKDISPMPMLKMEFIENLDSSISFWQNFLNGASQTAAQEIHDFGVVTKKVDAIGAEIIASSGDSDDNIQLYSPNSYQSSPIRDYHSSPEMAESSGHIDNPALSTENFSSDYTPQSPGIDVNISPADPEVVKALKDKTEDSVAISMPTGDNDGFWQQFLTEAPGSSENLQSRLERREGEATMVDTRIDDNYRYCWNMSNVDSLVDRIGQLASAERI